MDDFSADKIAGVIEENTKKLAKSFVENFASIALVLTTIFFITYSFTDVSLVTFSIGTALSLCADTIVLFICYTVVSNAYMQKGLIRGKMDAEYLRVRSLVIEKSEQIHSSNDQGRLHAFVQEYKEDEYQKLRATLLGACRGTEEEFSRYLDGNKKGISFKRRAKYREIKRLRPLLFTAEQLIEVESSTTARGDLPVSADRYRTRMMIKGFISDGVTVFFVASLAFQMISDPSFTTFVSCAIHLVAIVMRAFSGYIEGLRVYDTVAVKYHTAQLSKLHLFDEWKRTKGANIAEKKDRTSYREADEGSSVQRDESIYQESAENREFYRDREEAHPVMGAN